MLEELCREGALSAAPLLLGMSIVSAASDGSQLRATIVETEAYTEDDPASHSFRGITPRTVPMFGLPAHWYVYFTYGMHWCANVTCGPNGVGEAVLLRAAVVTQGTAIFEQRRGRKAPAARLLDGPAKLAQGFALSSAASGQPIAASTVRIEGTPGALAVVRTTARVGISQGTDRLWRFCADGAPRRIPGE
jgi:DNA-3-methyladenine glycosylase